MIEFNFKIFRFSFQDVVEAVAVVEGAAVEALAEPKGVSRLEKPL